jgi:hypothetical protein
MTCSVEFRVTGAGWADLVLQFDDKSLTLRGISYTTDALGDLVRAALMIATGAYSAQVSFDNEPGEHRLVLTSHLDAASGKGPVSIVALELADLYAASPNADGHQTFIADCEALDFGRAVLACAHSAQESFGATYDWGGNGFPVSALRALEIALVTRDPQLPV